MASDYLLKTEPSGYSFADLERDKVTEWDGVSNPVALRNLREMTPGTRLIRPAIKKPLSALPPWFPWTLLIPRTPWSPSRQENHWQNLRVSRKSRAISSSLIRRWFGRAAFPWFP